MFEFTPTIITEFSECMEFAEMCHDYGINPDSDTRNFSIRMDRFAFIAEVRRWQVENRRFTKEEIHGMTITWNLTHDLKECICPSDIYMWSF